MVLGGEPFEFTDNEFNHLIPDNIRILLETKENVSDPNEWLKRKKRIQFYSNLGVKY